MRGPLPNHAQHARQSFSCLWISSLLPPYRPRTPLSRSYDLGAKSRTSRPEQQFPVGFSTWVSRYLTHGGLGAAGSAAEAWFLRVGTRFRGPFFTVSNALHGETTWARRGPTDVGVSCYITNPEPEHVTSVTHRRRGGDWASGNDRTFTRGLRRRRLSACNEAFHGEFLDLDLVITHPLGPLDLWFGYGSLCFRVGTRF